jgi:hypothetical protein
MIEIGAQKSQSSPIAWPSKYPPLKCVEEAESQEVFFARDLINCFLSPIYFFSAWFFFFEI